MFTLNARACDGGPSGKPHIRPLTKAIDRRMEEEEGLKKTLLFWSVNY